MKAPFALVLLAPLAFGAFGAADADAKPDGRVAFGSLPLAQYDEPPRDTSAPTSIGAHERIAGFPVTAGGNGKRQRPAMVGTSSTSDDAPPAPDALCFVRAQGESTDSFVWSSDGNPNLMLPRTPGPVAIRGERLVDEGGATFLETVSAWVDPQSGGARQIAKARTLLERIASADPIGFEIFAARRPHAVDFIARARPNVASSKGASVAAASLDGQRFSLCNYARMPLAAQRDAAEAAAFFFEVELPQDPEGATKPVFTEDARGPRVVRMLRANISVSFTSRDAEPVIATSFGWQGAAHASGVE